jgi:hypothetical protein
MAIGISGCALWCCSALVRSGRKRLLSAISSTAASSVSGAGRAGTMATTESRVGLATAQSCALRWRASSAPATIASSAASQRVRSIQRAIIASSPRASPFYRVHPR